MLQRIVSCEEKAGEASQVQLMHIDDVTDYCSLKFSSRLWWHFEQKPRGGRASSAVSPTLDSAGIYTPDVDMKKVETAGGPDQAKEGDFETKMWI